MYIYRERGREKQINNGKQINTERYTLIGTEREREVERGRERERASERPSEQ